MRIIKVDFEKLIKSALITKKNILNQSTLMDILTH